MILASIPLFFLNNFCPVSNEKHSPTTFSVSTVPPVITRSVLPLNQLTLNAMRQQWWEALWDVMSCRSRLSVPSVLLSSNQPLCLNLSDLGNEKCVAHENWGCWLDDVKRDWELLFACPLSPQNMRATRHCVIQRFNDEKYCGKPLLLIIFLENVPSPEREGEMFACCA